jgi:hypothetical protein
MLNIQCGLVFAPAYWCVEYLVYHSMDFYGRRSPAPYPDVNHGIFTQLLVSHNPVVHPTKVTVHFNQSVLA